MMNEELVASINHLLAVAHLSEKELFVINARFGFLTGKPMLLEDVGKMAKVTRERVRQIEAKALRKIKEQKDIDLSAFSSLAELLPYIHLMITLNAYDK